MIRAIAFSVATVALHTPSVPINLQLDSQTCTAQTFVWEAGKATITGVVCADEIFRSGFE